MSLKLPDLHRWKQAGKGLGEGLTVTTEMMTRLNTVSSKQPPSKISYSQNRTFDKFTIDGNNTN